MHVPLRVFISCKLAADSTPPFRVQPLVRRIGTPPFRVSIFFTSSGHCENSTHAQVGGREGEAGQPCVFLRPLGLGSQQTVAGITAPPHTRSASPPFHKTSVTVPSPGPAPRVPISKLAATDVSCENGASRCQPTLIAHQFHIWWCTIITCKCVVIEVCL